MCSRCWSSRMLGSSLLAWTVWTLVWSLWIPLAEGMQESQMFELRKETEHLFYHGFENYLKYAFPEDELRPLTCGPLTRDREDPAHIELNDVLGNYSLTLVDSLSTLAILSSENSTSSFTGRTAWQYFQDGVKDFVELYGDGSNGPRGRGSRGKGFEFDSKVQVFETVIRGVGGLLSAHLFAVGDLPIRGYEPPHNEATFARLWDKGEHTIGRPGIRWDNGFVYDGQLLRLAMDLGTRILPAFYTDTGLPYPRVNLLHGVPFYNNSPLNTNTETEAVGSDDKKKRREITETCSAGAGSLVLEFTVLSRLTGDGRFEEFAKRAFWAVWDRRTDIGLIGSGIDAETGNWVHPYTGIGAGIDSFFEYAFKSYVLLSEGSPPAFNATGPFNELDSYFIPLSEEEHSSESFLKVWEDSQASIRHHLYRGASYQYPHYIQGDMVTGATRAFWIDSLSAYYPGLLTLAGDVDAAIEAHLLTAAVWNRFSALPERWNVATGDIEGGLGWWGGRPEFVESTFYLYRATKDPWYLHVGEMVLRDIKRRCWTKCGWAGIQDVKTGELSDRMESFFLGETAKYLFMLFDSSHPLNRLDAPFVFNTEGHPLVIPKGSSNPTTYPDRQTHSLSPPSSNVKACPAPATGLPFGVSSTAARPDVFHAASLARLHLMPSRAQRDAAIVEYAVDHPGTSHSDLISPSNYTYFPWTLPPELVPYNATSAPMAVRPTLDLSFPPLPNSILSSASLERVDNGILVKSLAGLRLGMIQDTPLLDSDSPAMEGYRIQVINNVQLGKDEIVYISKETTSVLNPTDPNFTMVRDTTMLDIVIDIKSEFVYANDTPLSEPREKGRQPIIDNRRVSDEIQDSLDQGMRLALASLMEQMSFLLHDEVAPPYPTRPASRPPLVRVPIPAIASTGKGSVPVPDIEDAVLSTSSATTRGTLPWSTIYFADQLCDRRLPASVPRTHQVIVVKRGGCNFSEKLRNIPSFRPSQSSLQLVIVVSYPQPGDEDYYRASQSTNSARHHPPTDSSQPKPPSMDFDEGYLIRPLLDDIQVVAGGIPRPKPLSMVMVGGGDQTYEYLRHAQGVGIRRRYEVKSQGVPISNLVII